MSCGLRFASLSGPPSRLPFIPFLTTAIRSQEDGASLNWTLHATLRGPRQRGAVRSCLTLAPVYAWETEAHP